MDQRYGRGKRSRRDRRIGIWTAGILGGGLVFWIFATVFLSPFKTSGEIAVFKAGSSGSATIIIDVKKPLESKALCGVSALNAVGGSVGSKQVVVDQYQTTAQVTLITTEPASDGQVDFCHTL